MSLIREACARGVAALVVTHDRHLASFADRLVALRDGRGAAPGASGAPGPRSAPSPGGVPDAGDRSEAHR